MDMSTPIQKNSANLSKVTTYHAGIMQATMHRKLQRFSDEVLAPYGLTKMHWLIVGTVLDHRATGVRITDLSKLLGTNLSYMTNTVNLLESRKILARMENTVDSRSRLITVHPKFSPQCKKIEASLRQALRDKIYSKIDVKDFQTYMKVMFQLGQLDITTEKEF